MFDKLYLFQKDGVAWLSGLCIHETGGILADEMGMGKTMQTLTFLFALMSTGAIKNALVVCPKSLMHTTWFEEANKHSSFFSWKHKPVQLIQVETEWSENKTIQVLKVARNW